MTRASWQGYIALGQLGIPVKLYSATRKIRPQLLQVHLADRSPIERITRCKHDHIELKGEEIGRAALADDGTPVLLNEEELAETTELPAKAIAIRQFAAIGSLPPAAFVKPFYVVPDAAGRHGYALLREVFTREQQLAITRFLYRGREYVAALVAEQDMLMLHQLRYTAEIIPRDSIDTPALPRLSPAEINAMTAVVQRFSGPLFLKDYHDEYAERLHTLVEQKAKGLPCTTHAGEPPATTADSELINALQSTLQSRLALPGKP